MLNNKRGLGGAFSPPHIVALVPLHRDANVQEIINKIHEYQATEEQQVFTSDLPSAGFIINAAKLKRKFNVSGK